jgi:hypothetical protein
MPRIVSRADLEQDPEATYEELGVDDEPVT